jgi:hypothetical protein
LALVLIGCSEAQALPEEYGEAAPLVEQARDQLAEQLGVDPTDIEVEDLAETEFPDASLGVPEPGQMYAQVITPGYTIVLEVGGETYEFHASGDRVVLVPEDRPDAAQPKPTNTPEA